MTKEQEMRIITLDSIIKDMESMDYCEIIPTLKSELSELKALINELNKHNGGSI